MGKSVKNIYSALNMDLLSRICHRSLARRPKITIRPNAEAVLSPPLCSDEGISITRQAKDGHQHHFENVVIHNRLKGHVKWHVSISL